MIPGIMPSVSKTEGIDKTPSPIMVLIMMMPDMTQPVYSVRVCVSVGKTRGLTER